MKDIVKKRLTLEAAIRTAIEKNEFILHYQPKVSLEDSSRIALDDFGTEYSSLA